MKSSEINQSRVEKTEKRNYQVLTIDEMFKIRGGGGEIPDTGKLK